MARAMIPLDPHAARIVHLQNAITELGRLIGCPSHGADEIVAYARRMHRPASEFEAFAAEEARHAEYEAKYLGAHK
jgi:hypothetical protein